MGKLRCAVLDDYQQVALTMANWSPVTDYVDVITYHQHFGTDDAMVDTVANCDIVVMMRERTPFRASLFNRLPRLKLLVTTGMRNASVDLVAAKEHGVLVSGTEGGPPATAELTWALILGLAKHVVREHQSIRSNGPWQTTIGTDLYGKQLGLLGLGRLGSQVARVGLAFGMNVVAWSQNLTQERADSVGVRLASSKDEFLKHSDFVSIHLVLSDRTRGLIGARELSLMKPSAYLVNTSRAPIVDQAALKDALRNQRIAGAGLDVYDVEPLPPDDEFRTLPNVLTTPHIGYVTGATYQTWYSQVVEDIQAFLAGTPIRVLT